MAQTANCIICYETADAYWSGNVLKDGKRITAGWCRKHSMESPEALLIRQNTPKGNYGQWNEKMGIYRTKPKKTKKYFTIEEMKNYISSQKNITLALNNLSPEKVVKVNQTKKS